MVTHNGDTTEDLENNIKKPKFGSRFLINETDVFSQNAWDNIEWNDEQKSFALTMVQKNSSVKLTCTESEQFKNKAYQFWNNFYGVHQNKFFKNRHWLFTEFPELAPIEDSSIKRCIFEIGCGVGNTLLPILQYSKEKNLKMYGCDFSFKAIEIMRQHAAFDSKRCQVFVMDATKNNWTEVPFDKESQDIIVLIFVLSAMEPTNVEHVILKCYEYLKLGGLVLFRDYGRYDLAQLRFKNGKCLEDNLYVRGDGTLVYFFTQKEVRDLFTKIGFMEEQNIADRRLQVNRSRMLKMYRVWIQAKYRKPQ